MMKQLGIIITMIFGMYSASAQTIQLRASAPKNVSIGEPFYLSFEANTDNGKIQIPTLNGFELLGGPNISSSNSTTNINGRMTQKQSYTYNYTVAAKKTGSLVISEAYILVKGEKYYSQPLTIQVADGNTQSQTNSSSKNHTIRNVDGADLFVRTHISKTKLYIGESAVATLKLYTKLDITGIQDIKMPSFNKLWIQDIPTNEKISLNKEYVNGEAYYTAVIAKKLIFPQTSGEIIIDPFEIELGVDKKVQSNRRRNVFDDFFGSSYETVKAKVKSPIVKLKVNLFPTTNRPDTYAGLVGDFDMKVTIDKDSINANEPLVLKIKLSGTGNLKLAKAPKVDFPPDFELYPPKIETNIKNTARGSLGTKTIEYIAIPRAKGDYRIAPVTLSYFNPRIKKYKTISSNEFNIRVDPGDPKAMINTSPFINKSNSEVVSTNRDIHYIETGNTKFSKKGDYLIFKKWYLATYPVAFFMALLSFFIARRKIKKNSDPNFIQRIKADKIAQQFLNQANNALIKNQSADFYDSLHKAIWGYLEKKLNIPKSDLSKSSISDYLTLNKVPDTMITLFKEKIEKIELAKFSANLSKETMNSTLNDTKELLRLLQKQIKNS